MSPVICDEQLPERLERALAAVPVITPRPAIPAGNQYGVRMSPQLTYGRHRGPAPWTARKAAVLALLVRRASGWHIPLAVRHEALTHHRGQIGLPGGQIEPGETSEQAARREFVEELGALPPSRMLGQLPACYVFASDFEVTPWIAVTDTSPTWIPCPTEVARIVEMPLTTLLDPAAVDVITIRRGLLTFQAPCYCIGDERVWGATAVILSELVRVVSRE
jgi:8-oxo-dGTP pyrophosphatase MutT (NUDIX family)